MNGDEIQMDQPNFTNDAEVVPEATENNDERHHKSTHHTHKRHRHRRRSRKNKDKLNEKLVLILSVLLIVIFAAVVLILVTAGKNESTYASSGSENADEKLFSVEIVNPEGLLVKAPLMEYLSTDLLNHDYKNIVPSDFAELGERLDVQIPVSLKLSAGEEVAVLYNIELSDNDCFNNATTAYLDSTNTTYEFKHLYANTQYYYRVTAYAGRTIEIITGTFKTADTPRILSIDGISNVRDIGNKKTDSGKMIRQGLLIRGTEMDGASEAEYRLTNAGLKDMLDILNIKTDIDLRDRTLRTMDALGAQVEHRYYNMPAYEDIFNGTGKEKMYRLFADLANPDIYPVYLHCTYGCDRTGTVCYLLEALLGVSEDDCSKDYGLSGMQITNLQAIENGLMDYEGISLKERVENYLLSCGISRQQIQSIRNIFLGV